MDAEKLKPVKAGKVFRLDGREVVVTPTGVRIVQGRGALALPRDFAEPLVRTLIDEWGLNGASA